MRLPDRNPSFRGAPAHDRDEAGVEQAVEIRAEEEPVVDAVRPAHALARTMLRASCGFLDASSGSDTLMWASEVREVAEEIERAGPGDALARAEPASWLWAIHVTDDEGGPAGSELPRGAIIIDVKRSRAWAANAPERVIDLPAAYQEHQRDIVRLSRSVEALV